MIEMGRILKEEKDLFEKLCSLERSKTGAILDHNGKLLEKISIEQEEILSSISKLEVDRVKHIESFKKQNHVRKAGISLSEITEILDDSSAGHMRVLGRNLKDVMIRLSRIQDTNRILIQDNMEYYNILMTGLRRDKSLETGYGSDGKEDEGLKNSILFNQKA
jgi:DNA-binding transcriptional MerR regulator